MIVPVVKCVPRIFKESLQVRQVEVTDPHLPVEEGVVRDHQVAEEEEEDLILLLPAVAAAPDQEVAEGPDK